MEVSANEEARILWDDVLDLLKAKELAPAVLAMLKSCTPEQMGEGEFHISTTTRFVKLKVDENRPLIEEALKEAAFEDLALVCDLGDAKKMPVRTNSEVTPEELDGLRRQEAAPAEEAPAPAAAPAPRAPEPKKAAPQENPLIEAIPENDSKLTFDRFVEGEENQIALQAAKQVADGENKSYNPLFIYGKSGLGKTHLLKAIQNYIVQTQPQRLCVYRTGTEFVSDYVQAMTEKDATARGALERHYHAIDVLIIDDIQQMVGREGTINFFFNTFNYLRDHGKQIVLAADRSPMQLGMGTDGLDERVTSRIDSGFTIGIEQPSYELKLKLVKTFYERMRQDAIDEHIEDATGRISDENLQLMAEKSGTNIRVISGFVQSCLMMAHRKELKGEELTRDDVIAQASLKWPTGQKIVTIEQIQKAVENYYGIQHTDLIGSKRNKELMEPRHVAIWLSRELTDNTLADIGKKFGGRSHATVMHSLKWVDAARKENRIFLQKVDTISEEITD
ncbi:MAG: chromosomal replication initiator protein DnaA [Atopobiaceae bacterium]